MFVSPTTEEGCLITDADEATAGLQVAVQVMHSGGQCNRGRLTYAVDDAEPVTLDDVLFDDDGFDWSTTSTCSSTVTRPRSSLCEERDMGSDSEPTRCSIVG